MVRWLMWGLDIWLKASFKEVVYEIKSQGALRTDATTFLLIFFLPFEKRWNRRYFLRFPLPSLLLPKLLSFEVLLDPISQAQKFFDNISGFRGVVRLLRALRDL